MEKTQKIMNSDSVFSGSFMDSRSLYMYLFQEPPNISWIDKIDMEKALKFIREKYANYVDSIYQYAEYNRTRKRSEFTTTMVVMKNKCVLDITGSYCDILHGSSNYGFANAMLGELSQFNRIEKKKLFEINIIVRQGNELVLKSMDINKTKLDTSLFYEDDFAAVDEVIRKRLNKKKDKGIVLLHGLPGTGKTTYLRYLVGRIKKKVLFVSPAVARCITDPEFIELLIDNPDCVLIIEDAENIIMDRRTAGGDSSVSNLLNISDGLLADFMNVQVICTFNSSLTIIDSALMRKGRLIAKYEFGKLSVEKASTLSKHLGLNQEIAQPMTLAEITNPGETNYQPAQVSVIGFRRTHELIEN